MHETVTRKRRRRAVDPSIGYYIYLNDVAGSLDHKPNPCDKEEDLPSGITFTKGAAAAVAEKTRPASPSVVGVEKLLRSLAQRNSEPMHVEPKKKHLSKKSSIDHCPPTPSILQLRSRRVTRTQLPNHVPSSGSEEPYEGKAKKHRQRRDKRPFKQRIYEAAVATHADPAVTLAQPGGIAVSNPPLHFEPLSPLLQRGRKQDTIIVNVACVNPLRPSSFSRPGDLDKVKFPLTHWRSHFPRARGGQKVSKGTKFVKDERAGQEVLECLPLNFVPLSQAEAGYKVMFQHSDDKQFLTSAALRSENMEGHPQPLQGFSPDGRLGSISLRPANSADAVALPLFVVP